MLFLPDVFYEVIVRLPRIRGRLFRAVISCFNTRKALVKAFIENPKLTRDLECS